jgi:transposase
MGAALELQPKAPASKTVEATKDLLKARDALVDDRVDALNRMGVAVSSFIKRQLDQRLRQIDRQIQAIEKRLKALRKADAEASERFDILISIPSFGEGTADALMVETPELRRLDHPQATSLVGVAPAPVANDSGKRQDGEPSATAARAPDAPST